MYDIKYLQVVIVKFLLLCVRRVGELDFAKGDVNIFKGTVLCLMF